MSSHLRTSLALIAALLAIALAASAGQPAPEAALRASPIEPEPPVLHRHAAARYETLWIFDADFSDFTGDNAGWTVYDLSGTAAQTNHWHHDTIRLTEVYLGESTWWCGTYSPCWRQPRGYGNEWIQHLTRTFSGPEVGSPGDTLELQWDQRYAMERSYDYGYVDLRPEGSPDWTTLAMYTNSGFPGGGGTPHDWDDPADGHVTINLDAYAGQDFDLRFRFESDAVYSSQDQPDNVTHSVKDGAWQFDNIELTVNSTRVFLDDAESGNMDWIHDSMPASGQTGASFHRGQFGIDFVTGREFSCDDPPVGSWMFASVDSLAGTMVNDQYAALVSPPIDVSGHESLIGAWDMWVDFPFESEDVYNLYLASGDIRECVTDLGGFVDESPGWWYGGAFWNVWYDDWSAFAGNQWLAIEWAVMNDEPVMEGHMGGMFLNRQRVGVPVGDPGTAWDTDVWHQFNDWFRDDLAEALADTARIKITDEDDIVTAFLMASDDGGDAWESYACTREGPSDWWKAPPPVNQMAAGSEILYYFEAMDGVGNPSVYPSGAPEQTLEFSILPITGSTESPGILIVDKYGGNIPGEDRDWSHPAQSYYEDALRRLGYEFDVYDVEVPDGSIRSHGPDTTGMKYYDTQFWIPNWYYSYALRPLDQAHLVEWLSESEFGDERNFILSGNNVGYGFFVAGAKETLDFFESWLGTDYIYGSQGDITVDSLPGLVDVAGGFDFITDGGCILQGSCPLPGYYDVIEPSLGLSGAELMADYVRVDMEHRPAGVAYTHSLLGYRSINVGFGVEFMVGPRQPSGYFADGGPHRRNLLGNIMSYLGKTPSGPRTFLVRPDGSGDFATIQAAVNAATAGDTIDLASGTFTGVGNRDVDFFGKAITVRSEDAEPALCVIDCEGAGRGFLFQSGEGAASVLRGVTVRDGLVGTSGGAISCSAASSPTIVDCLFEGNTASEYGGGAYCTDSSPTFEGCEFVGNASGNWGGGLATSGSAAPVAVDCTFDGNTALVGGAVYAQGTSAPDLEYVAIHGNSATSFGGAIYCNDTAHPSLTHVTMVDNSASAGAGAYVDDSASIALTNTIVAFSLLSEGVFCETGGVATLSCCDVYGNAGGDYVGCIAELEGTDGNISADPLFCDAGSGDYTIRGDSPCADENNPGCGRIGALGVGCYPTLDGHIFVRFDSGTNYVEPPQYSSFSAYICLENFSPGDGVRGVALRLNRTFNGFLLGHEILLPNGLEIGGPEDPDGWLVAGDPCAFPDTNGVVAAARIDYLYIDTPGILEIQDHPTEGRIFADCDIENVPWCVRLEPSGHGGVWAEPPPGDCPPEDLHPHRWDVPSEVATIQAAIDSSAMGDTVYVAFGTYYEHDITLSKSGITVMSAPARGDLVTIDAEQLGRVFSISAADSTTTITGFVLTGGQAMRGGGAFFWGGAKPRIEYCVFAGNSGTQAGGAISCYEGANPRISNCTFAANTAPEGSAIEFLTNSQTLTIDNSILAFNGSGEAVSCGDLSSVSLACCDVYGNGGGDWVGCLAGQDGNDGNISEDPLFCAPDSLDFELYEDSPCTEENDPICLQIGALGAGCSWLVDWDAGGDGETWEDPDNWDPDRVPGEDDHARIILDGTYTVYYNSTSTIWGLTHGASSGTQTLDIETGTLTVTDQVTNTSEIIVRDGATFEGGAGRDTMYVINEEGAEFTLDDGDLAGAATFLNRGLFRKIGPATSHVTTMFENQDFARGGTGTMEAEAGTLSFEGETNTDGRLNVNSGATAIVSQHFVRGERASGSLTNRGLVTVDSDGALGAQATLAIANEADGTVVLDDGDLIGAGTFTNRGLVRKIGSGTSHVHLTFNNVLEARGGIGTVEAEAGTLSIEGDANSDGRLNVNSGATAIVSQHFLGRRRQIGSLVSSGEIAIAGGGEVLVRAPAALTSSGTYESAGRTLVESGAFFDNSGSVTVGATGEFETPGMTTNEAGGTFENSGRTSVSSGGTLTNEGYFLHRQNAVLGGSGSFDNSEGTASMKGVIEPGGSFGTLTFTGDFVQSPTSRIAVEVGGYTPGDDFDQLAITGEAEFGGALSVALVDEFEPALGDSFPVITQSLRLREAGRDDLDFDCLSGLQFSDSLHMEAIQRPAQLVLRVEAGGAVNEPPIAAADSDSVYGYVPISVPVLGNDSDPDLDDLEVVGLVTEGTDGAAYIAEGGTEVVYVAVPRFAGFDTFEYVVTDCQGGADTALVTIEVTSPALTWRVPWDVPTIAAAMDTAAAGDTVLVACGTYEEGGIAVTPGVTLLSESGDPDCVIIDGSGRSGSVLVCTDADSTTVIAGLTITGGDSDAGGGGLSCTGSAPRVSDCVFAGNAGVSGGGVLVVGGSAPRFTDCLFSSNSADFGGGAFVHAASSAEFEGCVFDTNAATDRGGGAALGSGSSVSLLSTTFVGNAAPSGGGLSIGAASTATGDRLIVAYGTLGEAASCLVDGTASLTCSDVFGNAGGDWVACIAGQGASDGNFSSDPEFCAPDSGDFHLALSSPCADAPGCGLVGALAVGCVAEPSIDIEPASLTILATQDSVFTDILTVSNAGRAALDWYIREEAAGPREKGAGSGAPDGRRGTPAARRFGETAVERRHIELAKGESGPRADGPQSFGTGGPDAFGYRWIDSNEPGGPEFAWLDITGLDTPVPLGDDDSALVPLPFSFPFYAYEKTAVRVSSNGYLTFGNAGGDFSNDPIPDPFPPNDFIAPFWSDLDPAAGGTVSYYHDVAGERFIVQYDGVPDFWEVGAHTFQAVLDPSGSVLFQYLDMEGDGSIATVGIEDAAGATGLEIAHNQAYVADSLAVLVVDEAPWLTQTPPSGTVPSLDTRDVTIAVDGRLADLGEYSVDVVFLSNDPGVPEFVVPITVAVLTGADDETFPLEYALHANYPNPFNPTTVIAYDLPEGRRVSLRVYSVSGRTVRTLADGVVQGPGRMEVTWDGSDDDGRPVASGVYFYRLEADGDALCRKMIMLK